MYVYYKIYNPDKMVNGEFGILNDHKNVPTNIFRGNFHTSIYLCIFINYITNT